MNEEKKLTYFASAERSSESEIKEEHKKIISQKLLTNTLDTLQELILIVDKNRQIVYLNNAIFEIVGSVAPDTIYGLRSGEIFKCKHAESAPSGCGTSEHCKACGLLSCIIYTRDNRMKAEKEYRLTNTSGEALELKVITVPVEADGEKFTRISLTDISDEKRRLALERIFFHDIMNIAGGLQGISSILTSDSQSMPIKDFAEMIMTVSTSLIDEIKAQKQLKMAERGELALYMEQLESNSIIKDLLKIYSKHEVAEGKTIIAETLENTISFQSDKTILIRIIGNMLKNALESTKSGGEVRIGCISIDNSDELEFYVSNISYIPYEAQLQIFQRSFSTKGDGRGLGTYSMKLLGEKYLKGKVGFKTEENYGTKFFIRLKS